MKVHTDGHFELISEMDSAVIVANVNALVGLACTRSRVRHKVEQLAEVLRPTFSVNALSSDVEQPDILLPDEQQLNET